MPGFHTVNCRAFLLQAAVIIWGAFLAWRMCSLPFEKRSDAFLLFYYK